MSTNSKYNRYPEVKAETLASFEWMRAKRRRLVRTLLAEAWDTWTRYERTWKRHRRHQWKTR